MKRKIYSELLKWKEQYNGTAALLVDGARRVGKSWIVEEFAKNEYKSYVLIDFNNVQSNIIELFELYLTDLDTFFSRLSIYTNTLLYPRNTVIIFDEVQIYPRARAALKYLVKDGRFDYIETGSLVSINHNVKDIVIPSEEVRVNMFPMDLEEFMWATNQDMLYDFVREHFLKKQPMGQAIHRQMMEVTRTYLLVGGMPQAVLAYLKQKDFREADNVKRAIITLYQNDISKYAGRQTANVTRVFNHIPGALQEHEKRFRPAKVKNGSRMRDFTNAFFWLDESRVANFCYASTEPSIALAMTQDDSKLKIYMADTGLLVSMAFSQKALEGGVYEKILRDKLEFNKGMLVENLVAQLLRASGHPLYFYSSNSKEQREDVMEIDFLICKEELTNRHNICPIEVKSTHSYKVTSLTRYMKKFEPYISTAYVLHTGDVKVEDGITYLPLYMAGLL
jgi:predicted AAA+ superfamily ATPase